MGRTRPAYTLQHRLMAMASPPALVHAAWITAVVSVCLALCTIHSRSRSRKSSSSSGRRGATIRRREANNVGGCGSATATATATPAAKVSPTPRDAAKAVSGIGGPQAPATTPIWDDGAGPVTVIDVGTHGPIAPVFLLPDPQPPRRSLSVKHIRFAERLAERIRSRRWGADDEEEAGGCGSETEGGSTLWTKTILLGERCRVPSSDEDDGDDDGTMCRWKSYRPRQPRSVPVTRCNSFAGVDNRGSSYRPSDARL